MKLKIKKLRFIITFILTISTVQLMLTYYLSPDWIFSMSYNNLIETYPNFGIYYYYYISFFLYPQLLFTVSLLFLLLFILLSSIKLKQVIRLMIFFCGVFLILSILWLFIEKIDSKLEFKKNFFLNDYDHKEIESWRDFEKRVVSGLAKEKTFHDSLLFVLNIANTTSIHGYGESKIHIDQVDRNWTSKDWPVQVWWHLYSHDLISVYCGGHALYFKALLNEFIPRIDVYRYFIGTRISSDMTGHVINLIKDREGNYFLLDPMFNSYWSNEDEKLVCLREIIEHINNKREEKFQIIAQPSLAPYITKINKVFNNHPLYKKNENCFFLTSNNANYPLVYFCNRDLEHYLQFYSSDYSAIASYYGYPDIEFKNAEDFKIAIQFIRNIEGENAQLILEELEELIPHY